MTTREHAATTHEQVAADVAQFLANGGTIKRAKHGESGLMNGKGEFTKLAKRAGTRVTNKDPENYQEFENAAA